MRIREADESDFDAIMAIFNNVMATSTAIFSEQALTREEMVAWCRTRQRQGYPVLVAASEDAIAGYGSFGDFRARPGYRFTVEGTVHVDAGRRGQGVGGALLSELILRAAALNKHVMMAAVDAENDASLGFLERFGFERVGRLREVGYKFGRFLDLVLLQRWVAHNEGNGSER